MKKSNDDIQFKRFTASWEWNGSRLDRFIRAHYPGIPFSTAQMLIRKGRILVNGKRAEGDTRLEDGDTIDARIEEFKGAAESAAPGPETAENPAVAAWGTIGNEVAILFEDACVLVLNKPAGIVVQPGNRKGKGSLLDLLEEYRNRREKSPATEPVFSYAPVHRLDRETTGALVVAKTRPTARTLSGYFAEGNIDKVYLAVVHGTPSPKRAAVTKPIEISKGKSSRAAAVPGGREAHTHYRLRKILPGGASLLEVSIKTGRTHQIRVHLASIGHPVAGDRKYGSARGGRHERLLLHAWKIRFPHPESGEPIEVTAPPPPDINV